MLHLQVQPAEPARRAGCASKPRDWCTCLVQAFVMRRLHLCSFTGGQQKPETTTNSQYHNTRSWAKAFHRKVAEGPPRQTAGEGRHPEKQAALSPRQKPSRNLETEQGSALVPARKLHRTTYPEKKPLKPLPARRLIKQEREH